MLCIGRCGLRQDVQPCLSYDTVIKENRIPVEMIRAALTQQKLTPDFKSSWRFYDAPVQH